MDVFLEILDTYALDQFYAKVCPKDTCTFVNQLPKVLQNGASERSIVDSVLNGTYAEMPDIYGQPFLLDPSPYINESGLARDNLLRQALTVYVVTWIFGYILYLGTAYFSYKFIYDHTNFQHPKFLKNQVSLEIKQALSAIPVMTAYTVPWFLFELRGYSKLYWKPDSYGWAYFVIQFPLFIMFTDMGIYMIHRWLHWPGVYKHLHKPHHKWLVPTPFASHAFHPMDGYMQSVPYHLFPFVFPLQKVAYMALFVFVNIWSVMIHDGEYLANNPVINGSACHTIHHLYFNYNYGQYTTLWDRLGSSHRTPDQELFDKSMRSSKKTWEKQISAMEKIKQDVEGEDDRVYATDEKKTK